MRHQNHFKWHFNGDKGDRFEYLQLALHTAAPHAIQVAVKTELSCRSGTAVAFFIVANKN